MSEINRVFAHIDAFFEAAGTDHCMALANVIGRCAALAHRGFRERDMEDEALLGKIRATLEKAKDLGTNSPPTVEGAKKAFRDLAVAAMTCRRAILPLPHPRLSQRKPDPEKALFDDEDQYSFAIYDTLADEIGEVLPDLQRFAVEVAWDADKLE